MRYILEIIHIDGSTESVPCDATRETLGWIHAYGRQYSEATGRIGRPHLGAWPASALRKYTKVDTTAPAPEPKPNALEDYANVIVVTNQDIAAASANVTVTDLGPWTPYAQRPHRA